MTKRVLLLMLLMLVMCCAIVFAGDQKIGGLVFFDFGYDLTEDADNDGGFNASRVYLTISKKLDDNLTYKFQTDIDYKNSPKNVYLKNAKVDWKTNLGKITLGLQGMNVFGVQEKTWGYRFIEKSSMDRNKFSSSADLGVGYSNTFGSNIHLSALLTNGTGYKKAENDSHKKISIQSLIGQKKLSSKDGYNGGVSFTMEPYDVDSVTVENKTVFGLFGGFAGSGIRVGGEFNTYSDAGADLSKQIISAYAIYGLSDDLNVFGRFDMYDPDTDTDSDSETYIIAGLEYKPAKGLYLAPNLKMTTPEGGDAETVVSVNCKFKF